jgi:serine/threonine protein kinase
VHLGDDSELRILDLGVARSGLDHDADTMSQAGTPSFLAPEQFDRASASPQSDIYAAGVTIYLMLTRRYPFGEIEPFQRPASANRCIPRATVPTFRIGWKTYC